MADFAKKVVAIVGAASSIGSATAVLYAKQGATLILFDAVEEELDEVASKCREFGSEGMEIVKMSGDPSDPKLQMDMLKLATDRFGQLDVLVNILEVKIPGSPIPGIDFHDFETSLDTNLKAVGHMCINAVNLLRKTKGNIVNVSSAMGQKPTKNNLSYCVSKAGLDMFTKCMALDLGSHGIRVNSVNPCFALPDKDFTEDSEEYLKAAASRVPMGRLAKVEEVAESIVFLSSEKASFTTGQLLGVDGGYGI